VTQVLTRNLLLDVMYEATNSQGFLSNPYRQARYLDSAEPLGYAYEAQVYPQTRSGNAGSVVLKYYLPWRASVSGNYRSATSGNWRDAATSFIDPSRAPASRTPRCRISAPRSTC
jgi:hypothetical protein